MEIIHVTNEHARIWAQLCHELWPHNTVQDMLEAYDHGDYQNEYVAKTGDVCAAFISLSVRTDYVEGKTGSKPVGYVEGIYVRPEYRKRGIAKELVDFAKKWSDDQGCSMLASDCALSNEESRSFHNALGFHEAGVQVHFTMHLNQNE
jgi:aminoglycoside 6'-N-acetyltransferase I